MKLNDKLKAEIKTLINEPPYERIVPYYLVNSKRLDDIIDQTINETIKHCAEVVGEDERENNLKKVGSRQWDCIDCGEDCDCETHNDALIEAKQRLLDLIK